jgi:beta-lactam-binding protein with PASTA domain
MTLALATAAIIEAQLVLGNVTEANSDTVPVGCVISSDPIVGTRLSVGDPVHVVVSLGPAE